MKQLYKLVALVGVVTLSTACYEDKGNYDYKDINEIIIDMGTLDRQTISIGETIEFNPTIKFVNGQGDLSRFDFKWILIPNNDFPERPTYTQDDWNTINFKWTPEMLVPNGLLRLEATDKVTGIIYYGMATCSVSSKYDANGGLILAEKDGKTQLSFIKVTKETNYLPSEFMVYNNAYSQANDSDLPANPIKIHTHFCYDQSTIGQLLILTENGAYDIDGKEFKKELELAEAFENKVYPAGFNYAKDAMFMSYINVVADAEGHLYTRIKNTSELFHSGYFLHEKLRVKGETEDLKGCSLILAPFANMKACLVYEKPKKRFLLIADAGTGRDDIAENAGRPILLGTPADAPPGFLPLNNMGNDVEILSTNFFRGSSFNIGYSIVFQKEGKIFCQEFELDKDYFSMAFDVINPKIYEITGLPGKPTYICPSSYWEYNSLALYAVNNKLFVHDRGNPKTAVVEYIPKDQDGKPVDVFTGNIVAIDGENYMARWMVVGLSDGRALILRFKRSNYPDEQVVHYDSGSGVYGKITDVRCKLLGGNNWNVNK